MLDDLKFVQGSVAKKDYAPALTHFKIANGVIRGYNGLLSLSSPILLDLNVNPKAQSFVKAIETCKETIQMHVTAGGKLSIKSGKFKALVECTPEEAPELLPEGEIIPLNGDLLKTLKTLSPFIAEDASRPWARGILLKGQSAFATNNLILVEKWLGYAFPAEVNLPKATVMELIRIGLEPTSVQISTNGTITFNYEGGRWLCSLTYTTEWPDLSKVLNQGSNPIPLPENFWSVIEDLKPFTDELGKLFFTSGVIATAAVGDSTQYEVPGLAFQACFNVNQLLLLKSILLTVDFSNAPKPCLFFGAGIRGAITGIRS